MKIQRTILKCKSKLYYYALLFIGSTTILFLTRCYNTSHKNKTQEVYNTTTSTQNTKNPTSVADSVLKAENTNTLDSIKKTDTIKKNKRKKTVKPQNPKPFVPNPQPAVDYGILPAPDTPVITKYGVPFNEYKK